METSKHTPLHLYKNYQQYATQFADTPIYFDEPLFAFPEAKLETTYLDSLNMITKRAKQLATAGIQKNDFVMLYKSQAIDTYWLAVAVSYLGAVPVMTSGHLSTEVIRVFSERLERSWVVYDSDTQENVSQLPSEYQSQTIAIETLLTLEETDTPLVELPHDQISYLTHTSGTTGIPKLIAHSANSMGWRVSFQVSVLAKIDCRDLLAFHISPVHSRVNIGMTSLMALGFPYLAIKNPSTDNVEKLFTQFSPVAIETHPNNFIRWAQLAKEKPHLFENIRYYHSTFDAINKETIATFLKSNKDKRAIYLQIYGQSECGPSIVRKHTLETIDGIDIRNMGVGYLDYTKSRITTPTGEVLPPMTPGHIHLYSKGRALTYYKEDERFNANVYGEWWDTGDYGMMTEDGDLLLYDRQIDLVETLPSTLAIEDFILDNMDSLEEVIIVRDKNGYPQPVIAVKHDEPLDLDTYFKVIANLPHLNHPITLPYDQIPRTATMKVQRRELEKQLFN